MRTGPGTPWRRIASLSRAAASSAASAATKGRPKTSKDLTCRTARARLLVALTDRATEADLAVVDPDVEAALRIRADPGLVGDRRAVTTVVRERQHVPLSTLLAPWVIHLHRHSSPPLNWDTSGSTSIADP